MLLYKLQAAVSRGSSIELNLQLIFQRGKVSLQAAKKGLLRTWSRVWLAGAWGKVGKAWPDLGGVPAVTSL